MGRLLIFVALAAAVACLSVRALARLAQLPLPPDALRSSRASAASTDADASPSSASSSALSSSWSSPHLVDCRAIPVESADIFVNTSTSPSFHMNIHDARRDAFISGQIRREGCWECGHIRGVQDALARHPGAYFLDVGGNIGMWTLAVAAMGRESYTVEPFPENYRRICKTVNRNGSWDWTHILNVAATADPANLTLSVPGDANMGGVSVRRAEEGGGGSPETAAFGVPIDSLGLPADRPVVMKVDVEGYELEALAGARNFLRNASVVYAAMELRPHIVRSHPNTREIFDILSSKGLRPYREDYGRETRLDPSNLGEWVHFKHPKVRYFDVTWRQED